jgi:hypothetical protein
MDQGDPDRLTVLKRNRLENEVSFECPTCRQAVELGPTSLRCTYPVGTPVEVIYTEVDGQRDVDSITPIRSGGAT